jgi:hypothetical protein
VDESLGTGIALIKEDRPDERLQSITIYIGTPLTCLAADLKQAIKAHTLGDSVVDLTPDDSTTALTHLSFIPVWVMLIEVMAHCRGQHRVTEELQALIIELEALLIGLTHRAMTESQVIELRVAWLEAEELDE